MSEKRNVRANQTRNSVRDEEARPMTAWKPPSLLDAPEARPGYVQRWVATSIQGKESPDNVYKRMREGWEPRPAESVKSKLYPTINPSKSIFTLSILSLRCISTIFPPSLLTTLLSNLYDLCITVPPYRTTSCCSVSAKNVNVPSSLRVLRIQLSKPLHTSASLSFVMYACLNCSNTNIV